MINFASSGFELVMPTICRWRSQLQGKHQPVNTYVYNQILIDPAADVPYVDLQSWDFVSHVVATHVQEEHIAGAVYFKDARILVPAGDEYLCNGMDAYEKLIEPWSEPWDWSERGNFRGHLAGAKNERPPQCALQIQGVLRDGDCLHGLRVISTPGHGKNAITFLAENDGKKIAFCGDLICDDGKLWNWFDCDWDYGLEGGQRALLASAKKFLQEKPDVLLPAHGDPIFEAEQALQAMIDRLERVLCPIASQPVQPLNFPDNDTPNADWRKLSEHLYQYKTGNCALLVSESGAGLLVDDGLCRWVPWAEQAAHHRQVISRIKHELGLSHIEAVLITHYHGDHIYNIPTLLKDEQAVQVITLDTIAPLVQFILEDKPQYNLSAPLWWYGCEYQTVPIHRTLRDGEVFQWHEYKLQLFHLGGQTYYHCGIQGLIDGARVLFVGDAIYGWDESYEPVLTYNDAEPSQRGWAYAIDRMMEREPDILVCGHGSAVRNPLPLLHAKRAAWEERLSIFDMLNARHNRRVFFDPLWEDGGK